MSEQGETSGTQARGDAPAQAAAAPARRQRRLRAYLQAWLLAAACFASFVVLAAMERPEEARDRLRALLFAPLFALLVAPSLWLVRLVPERSPSSWLRFVRRLLVGATCGSLPGTLLAALTLASREAGAAEGAGVVWTAGVVVGLLAGLVDSMHLDRVAQRG